jgi:hypothetical protein
MVLFAENAASSPMEVTRPSFKGLYQPKLDKKHTTSRADVRRSRAEART